jgi:hypothetical protein
MNKGDREEVRQLLVDVMGKPLEAINGQYRLVSNQLTNIETQTIKTNGRVTQAEHDIKELQMGEIKHVVNCPMVPRLEKIETNMLFYKWIKNNPKLAISGLLFLILLLIGRIATPVIDKNAIEKQLIIDNNERIKADSVLAVKLEDIKKKYSINTSNE